MAQIFPRSANSVAKVSIVVVVILVGTIGRGGLHDRPRPLHHGCRSGAGPTGPVQSQAPRHRRRNRLPVLPHVGGKSSFAGIPPTETCMSCHSQIWNNAAMLEPVRASFRTGESSPWTRVHDLPDFVYFNHSIHVNKGIGCSTCHGRIDLMPLTYKVNTLYMNWCVNCHRHPEQFVRPAREGFQHDLGAARQPSGTGAKLVAEYKIQRLTDCWTCHR